MSDYFNTTGTIGFTCDNCGRELLGCTWVNGMKFCAKCYQETFGASKDWQLLDKDKTIAEQRKQIADLEAKLAEKEKKIADLKDKIECLEYTVEEYEQDTPDLIITELNKVKKYISNGLAFDEDVQIWFEQYIDNQIKAIKEME